MVELKHFSHQGCVRYANVLTPRLSRRNYALLDAIQPQHVELTSKHPCKWAIRSIADKVLSRWQERFDAWDR